MNITSLFSVFMIVQLILIAHHSNRMLMLNKSVSLFPSLLPLVSMVYSIVYGFKQNPGKHWNGGEHIRAYSRPNLGSIITPKWLSFPKVLQISFILGIFHCFCSYFLLFCSFLTLCFPLLWKMTHLPSCSRIGAILLVHKHSDLPSHFVRTYLILS